MSDYNHPPTLPMGKLIVFEGIDGTGKSTQIQLLASYLREKHALEVITSFEPTRGPWGMRVRHAVQTYQRLSLEEEIDCLLRDRREHVETLIRPSLARGAWVLLDRYYPSMMAYQGASGHDVTQIQQMNEEFAPRPDLACYLRISLEESQRRIASRGLAKDAFELDSFQARVAHVFDSMEMSWWKSLDAEGPIDDVHARIIAQIEPILACSGCNQPLLEDAPLPSA